MKVEEFHARAIACHCQCLAYNAANMMACVTNKSPPFPQEYYEEAMIVWGLMDKHGKAVEVEE